MPVGSLDATFLNNTQALKDHATGVAAAHTGAQLRRWYLAWLAGWSGDPLDLNGMADAFARTGLGAMYGAALTDNRGASGDAASAKLQSDYLGAMERAFRLRHATPIRCALHAAARRLGHSHAGAGIFARVETYAQDLIVAGAAGFKSRDGT
jgi:hypothetical protein